MTKEKDFMLVRETELVFGHWNARVKSSYFHVIFVSVFMFCLMFRAVQQRLTYFARKNVQFHL